MKARSVICASTTLHAAGLVVATFNSSNHVSHAISGSIVVWVESSFGWELRADVDRIIVRPRQTSIAINLVNFFSSRDPFNSSIGCGSSDAGRSVFLGLESCILICRVGSSVSAEVDGEVRPTVIDLASVSCIGRLGEREKWAFGK